MSLQTQAARGLKWQAIEIGGRQLLGLVVFTTLARLLDPADFGLVGLVAVYLAFVAIIAQQGVGTALIQRQQLDPEHLDAAFWFNMACAILLCLGTMAAAHPIASMFGEPQIEPLLKWASLTLIINASASVHGTLFMREMDFRRPAVRTLIANLAGGATGVSMAYNGLGAWALVGQQLAASLAGACFLWAASPWRPRPRFSYAHMKTLMGMSSAVFTTSLLWFISSRADQFFIGRFLGPASLGFYVVGAKPVDMARTALYQPMGAVSLPALSRAQDDRAKLRSAVYRGMTLNATVAVPALIGLAAIAPDAVPVLFGSQWLEAVPAMQLLALYTLTNGLQTFYLPLLLATGGPGGYLLLNALHASGVIAVCALAVGYGIAPLIVGLIVNGLIIGLIGFIYLMRRVGLEVVPFWMPCLWPLLAASVMYAVVSLARTGMPEEISHLVLLLVNIILGAIVYSGLMLLCSRQSVLLVLEFLQRALQRKQVVPGMPS